MRRSLRGVGVAIVAAFVVSAMAVLGQTSVGAANAPRPVVFVHGVLGSGNQFESQSMRFTSNGYPIDWIAALDYDSLNVGSNTEMVRTQLDDLIAHLKSISGSPTVDLVGHSLGTSVVQGYLNSTPERAANVAHYVNLDGAQASALPGGVATLAVWGQGDPARTIVGATNVYQPTQTHTQTVTSRETFLAMYPFFTNQAPTYADIVKQPAGSIELSGRAHLFPSNDPVIDAELQIFAIDPATGARLGGPKATFTVTDGAWGPFNADPSTSYEFAVVRGTNTHHMYFEPFVHSSKLMRLLTSNPGEGLDALWERGPGHANMVLLRNKEWWGDQGPNNDVLTINGTNVINAATSPISKRALAAFVWDVGVDGVSHPDVPAPAFASLPFLTGVDLYMPAATPPDGTIVVQSIPRLGGGVVVGINVPNWPSDTDRITIQFNDFNTTIDAPVVPTPTPTPTPMPTPPIPPTPLSPPLPVVASPSLTG